MVCDTASVSSVTSISLLLQRAFLEEGPKLQVGSGFMFSPTKI